MITRRSIMAFLGLAPVFVAQKFSHVSKELGPCSRQLCWDLSGWDLPPHLQDLAVYIDDRTGDMATPTRRSLTEILKIRKELIPYGFRPYSVFGATGPRSQIIPIYVPPDSISVDVWLAFCRKYKNKRQIIPFQTSARQALDFGIDNLYEAINS